MEAGKKWNCQINTCLTNVTFKYMRFVDSFFGLTQSYNKVDARLFDFSCYTEFTIVHLKYMSVTCISIPIYLFKHMVK